MTKIIQHVVSKLYKIEDLKYIKITRNQLHILDALMKDGSYKKYYDKNNTLKYSEHFGMLDFNKCGIEKIIVSGETSRVDEDDLDILLPENVDDAKDYEYIFHTHPPTPIPGARVNEGILYEFPSISDIYHFAEHYNDGHVQGSIVIAPEGLYLIKCRKGVGKRLQIPNTIKTYNKMLEKLSTIQLEAIDKYGHAIDLNTFYSKVAQNYDYIKKFNKIVNKYWGNQLIIHYKSRKYDKETKEWYIPSFYIPISIIEPIQNKKKSNLRI